MLSIIYFFKSRIESNRDFRIENVIESRIWRIVTPLDIYIGEHFGSVWKPGCYDLLIIWRFEKIAQQCTNVLLTGVLEYCPPEVSTEPRFHAVPANVWALGVLLYEMVNACPPFHNQTEIKEAKVTFQNTSLSNGEWMILITLINTHIKQKAQYRHS